MMFCLGTGIGQLAQRDQCPSLRSLVADEEKMRLGHCCSVCNNRPYLCTAMRPNNVEIVTVLALSEIMFCGYVERELIYKQYLTAA